MARGLCILLAFSIIGAYTCMALDSTVRTIPIPSSGRHAVRRSPEDNWPVIYPGSIATIGGVYASHHNGVFTADGAYNDRPVYRNGAWSIYYRVSGQRR